MKTENLNKEVIVSSTIDKALSQLNKAEIIAWSIFSAGITYIVLSLILVF